jgi:hypothetical protein
MSAFAQARAIPWRKDARALTRRRSWPPYLLLIAAATTGVLAALPAGRLVLVGVVGAVWLLVWTHRWRAAFVALFVCLPVAAVPGLLLQQQGWPTLLKDGLFLLPAYVGLSLAVVKRPNVTWPLPPALTAMLAALVVIVLLQAVRLMPSLPLVSLVGLRAWLLYLPLILVPAVAIASIQEAQRLIRLLVVVSLIPATLALVEFALIASGRRDLAYSWYGSLGSGVSQGFLLVGVSDQLLLNRISSTFTFFTQFAEYCLLTTPLCLVIWMSDPDARWRRVAGLASVSIIAAGLASGSRTFYLWCPIEIALVLVLMNRGRFKVVAMIVSGGAVAVVAIGAQLLQVATFVTALGWRYLVEVQPLEFPRIYQAAGLMGLGAGIDTNGSRYVIGTGALPYDVQGWYGLAFLELGLPGLAVILIIWFLLVRHAWLGMLVTRASAAGPLAVAAFVILICTVLNIYKGISLEYEPLNVYFWAVTGLALALPRLAAHANQVQNPAAAISGDRESMSPR